VIEFVTKGQRLWVQKSGGFRSSLEPIRQLQTATVVKTLMIWYNEFSKKAPFPAFTGAY